MGANGLQAKLGDYSTGFPWTHKTLHKRADWRLVVLANNEKKPR